jgi:hypothetical protein
MALRDSIGNSSTQPDSPVVIGLFSNGNDAQQAIGELREEGFRTNQIGAAFRETVDNFRGNDSSSVNLRRNSAADANRTLTENSYTGSDSLDGGSLGGPASGSNAVTPAGLSTGSGMSMTGAGRPGPIPGSEIPHHRTRQDSVAPAETVEETPASSTGRVMDIGPADFDGVSPDVVITTTEPAPVHYFGTEREKEFQPTSEGEGWWEKLKRMFTDEEPAADSELRPTDSVFARKSSRNFGTGEGDLGLAQDSFAGGQIEDVREAYDFAYSPGEFEASLASLGLDPRQARAFSRQLGTQGAIVTVAAGSKASEAESILQRNNGRIRHEEDADYGNRTLDEPLTSSSALPQTTTRSQVEAGDEGSHDRIQLFGEVRRAYGQRTVSAQNDSDSDVREDLRRPA